MKTPIAASAFSAIIAVYGITPVLAESFTGHRPESEDSLSANRVSAAYQHQSEAAELPAAQTQNGVTFVSGGIGKSEASAMRAAARHYDLMLIFADRGGHFLANVKVKIQDREGHTVLETMSDPILLANLPAGRYTLQAESGGKKLVKNLNVTNKDPLQVVYHWPTRAEKNVLFGKR